MNDAKSVSLRAAVNRVLIAAAASAGLMIPALSSAAELPVACIAGSCGARVPFVSSGNATAVTSGNTLDVNQTSDRAILNWSSFNVGADGRVNFNQPSRSAIALNRIYQNSPSRIFGQVHANGEIYLVNPNGIVFGKTAKIDAAGILASTLDISDSTFTTGIAAPSVLQAGKAALSAAGSENFVQRLSVLDADNQPVLGTIDAAGNIVKDPNGKPITVELTVQQGAQLKTSGANGRILLAAQNVSNSGSITATDGQVILAAGDSVFLEASSNPALRGLTVEVAAGGKVWNQLTGQIATPRGNATLVGFAVNQDGRISASTSVAANGSVRLLARDNASVTFQNSTPVLQAARTGKLEFGSQSVTSVVPDLDDPTTAVDDQAQLASHIEAMGRQVTIKGNALLRAKGGRIDVTATGNPARGFLDATDLNDGKVAKAEDVVGGIDRESQLRIESGATIDVSGSDATLPMSRNLVTVELRGSELAGSPSQRDGALRGKTVVVDARTGTTLADVSGALAAVPKTVAERTSRGGQAVFVSDGDIVANTGSVVDVSGGSLTYQQGVIATSQLIGADGKIYDIATADPTRSYVGVINPIYRRVDDRWGQIELSGAAGLGRIEPGYVKGSAAGTLQFAAPSLVLNGSFNASTIAGPYQRAVGSVPAGGRFIVGVGGDGVNKAPLTDYRAPAIEFVSTPPSVSVGEGSPLLSEGATVGPTLKLPTDYLDNGFTRTEIYSNGSVTVPQGAPLQLTAGSSFAAMGQSVTVLSNITNPGGAISLLSRDALQSAASADRPGIVIGDDVILDVRGLWTNDSLLDPEVRPVNALLPNGGSISLAVGGDGLDPQLQAQPAILSLGDNVQLRASGGANVSRTGEIVAGKGGAISLLTNGLNTDMDIGENVGLEGLGVAGAAGGSFNFIAPTIEVGDNTTWSNAQVYDAGSPTAFFAIGSALFSDYGFATVNLTAARVRASETEPDSEAGDTVSAPLPTDILRILPGTNVDVRVKSLLLNADAGTLASAINVADFSKVVLADTHLRQAAHISFTASLADAASGVENDRAGDLTVGVGADLHGDVGTQFAFSSVGNLFIDGTIRAPGGTIKAGLQNPASDQDHGFIATQRLQIGATALLDVSGASVFIPDDVFQLGSVVAGGRIELASNRGSVLVDSGAQLDISGSAAALDIATGNIGQPYVRQTVASSAGSLVVRAPESIGLYGEVNGAAGKGDVGQAAAGSLSLELTRQAGFLPADDTIRKTFPDGPRSIEISNTEIAGHALPENGVARISQNFIRRSGIDSLSLRADDSIVIRSDGNLSLARQLNLNTPQLTISGGGRVDLAAPYVSIGSSLPLGTTTAPLAGSAVLDVQADFIDLIGSSTLSSMSQATLHSSGDIRLRGTTRTSDKLRPIGSLDIAGDLSLQAARIYGATNTQFTITANGGLNDRIAIQQTGKSAGTPMSVGSSLTVVAKQIEQGGTLLAPFGSISLEGSESVKLLDGSLTSVSANGTLFPYGSVAIGEWIYTNEGVASPITALPERQVSIAADVVTMASTAVVDVSGGGDLYAYEWVPGTGGRNDALAPGATPGLYAIVPSLQGQFAPYDPQEYAGSDLLPGASIYLSGTGDLPAGTYALLPARYALLPGAYLVSAVGNTNGIAPGSVASLKDDTPVVAGYTTFGNTQLGNTQYSGFAIRPGTYGRALAQYDDSLASSFFPAREKRLELDATASVADAGGLSLFAGTQLDAQGSVLTAAAKGGRDATIDVSALHLAVINDGDTAPGASVAISAQQLREWNPGTLILGGHVAGTTDRFEVTADTIDIGVRSGVDLAFDQIILAAHDDISIGARATLGSSGSTAIAADVEPVMLNLSAPDDAGAAIVAVSDFAPVLLNRGNAATPGGSIHLDAGSTISSRGAITIDAPAGGELRGAIDASGARLAVGADRLVLGSEPAQQAFVIDSRLESSLQQANALRLEASTIDLQRAVAIDLSSENSELELLAGTIDATLDASSQFSAHSIKLGGAATANTAPVQAGSSQLAMTADTLELGAGFLDLAGFARTTLTARQQVTGAGKSRTRIGGDLDVVTPVIALATAAETSIVAADGTARLSSTGASRVPTNVALGGSLQLSANRIEDATAIVAGSGLVSLLSNTQLELRDGASIDVAGRQVAAGGRVVGSQGGSIRLAAGGDLNAAAGTSLLLDGAGGSSAGNLDIRAGGVATLNGSISAKAATNAIGGSFDLVAGSLGDFTTLTAALQNGGFTHAQHIRVRSGDLSLDSSSHMTAQSVSLVADEGAIHIGGTITAPGSATRGVIRLYADTGVELLSGGVLNADAGVGSTVAGEIEIGATSGSVDLAPGSVISARGATGNGSLLVTASLNDARDDVRIDRLAADLSGIGSVNVAPMFPVDIGVGSGYANAASFYDAVTNANAFVDAYGAAVRSRLSSGASEIVLRPQIELEYDGDLFLDVSDPLALDTWRFGGEAGSLVVRTTGSLFVSGNISDGVVADSRNRLDLLGGESSSIALVAGADLDSADVRATAYDSAEDLTIGGIVRTGTGNIALAASNDVVFTEGSSVYTLGTAGAASQVLQNQIVTFPDQGGSIYVHAGHDVVGSKVAQSVTAWQFRGTRTVPSAAFSRLYGINPGAFGWNLGTLGGGDLSVTAGHDVKDLSAATADSAVVQADNSILHFGGGSMAIDAGNDVNSSLFFASQGTLRIHADGALGSDRTISDGFSPLGTSLALGNAQATIETRGDILLERVLNPTVLAMPVVAGNRQSFFFTYGDNSSVSMSSAAGDVYLAQGNDRTTNFEPAVSGITPDNAFLVMPSSVVARSFSGDIIVNSALYMFPSDKGQLDLFASRDISGGNGGAIRMSDGAAAGLPTVLNAQANATAALDEALKTAASSRHIEDTAPVLVTAGRDIRKGLFYLPKAARFTADRDIADVSIFGQNLNATDVTLIQAGRDFAFSSSALNQNSEIAIGGPGQVAVLAGRNVDLGFTRGISTTGRHDNPTLPTAEGAAITVAAGLGEQPDYAGFIERIIAPSSDYDEQLIAYVARLTKSTLSRDAALAAFKALSVDAQRPFIDTVFFNELVQTGRAANASGAGFERGYAAIDALFPSSGAGSGDPSKSKYSGDLNMAFSRIYTLAGGDISLLIPGGRLNVGLANPPPTIAARNPSELGIVAQGAGDVHIFADQDVLVNSSRIFTLLGGDIAVWSTHGNIDAGRGAKSSLAAPAPTVTIDPTGRVEVSFTGAVTGSGIRTIVTADDVEPGDVDLIAPSGFVNAGDAGIGSAGNLNIAAQSVIGLDNIQVGGTSTGVPAETSGLGASLAGVTASASSSSKASSDSVSEDEEKRSATPQLAQTALSWLDVFVVGLGEENCKQDDMECLKRQKVD